MLESISQALRELPDQSLFSLLQYLRAIYTERKHRQQTRSVRTLLPPPRDPRGMERGELQAYLQNPKHFPYKADLLEFARLYEVPVNARTPREEIVRLCLRMIYDIPKGFMVLRFLAQRHDPPILEQPPPVLHEVKLHNLIHLLHNYQGYPT